MLNGIYGYSTSVTKINYANKNPQVKDNNKISSNGKNEVNFTGFLGFLSPKEASTLSNKATKFFERLVQMSHRLAEEIKKTRVLEATTKALEDAKKALEEQLARATEKIRKLEQDNTMMQQRFEEFKGPQLSKTMLSPEEFKNLVENLSKRSKEIPDDIVQWVLKGDEAGFKKIAQYYKEIKSLGQQYPSRVNCALNIKDQLPKTTSNPSFLLDLLDPNFANFKNNVELSQSSALDIKNGVIKLFELLIKNENPHGDEYILSLTRKEIQDAVNSHFKNALLDWFVRTQTGR